jgi:Uma2 family endonuclease
MSVSEKKVRYTFEEYLALEEKADYKSEFYQGEIFAMSGGTDHHSLIGMNLGRELGNSLMGKNCFVFGSDLKVKVDASKSGFYPDAMVVCGPREYYRDRRDTILNPTLVIEVLSDSTGAWDRGGKFLEYETLQSMQEYVLVEQKTAQIDVFHRNDQGFWVLKRYGGLDAEVEFKSLGVSIPTNLIYYGVEFE